MENTLRLETSYKIFHNIVKYLVPRFIVRFI